MTSAAKTLPNLWVGVLLACCTVPTYNIFWFCSSLGKFTHLGLIGADWTARLSISNSVSYDLKSIGVFRLTPSEPWLLLPQMFLCFLCCCCSWCFCLFACIHVMHNFCSWHQSLCHGICRRAGPFGELHLGIRFLGSLRQQYCRPQV